MKINKILRTKLIQETSFVDLFNFTNIAKIINIEETIIADIVKGLNLNGTGGVNNGPIKLSKIPSMPAINNNTNPEFVFVIFIYYWKYLNMSNGSN